MSASAEMLAFFDRQRETYGRMLPARLATIDALWLRVSGGGTEAERHALEREAHSLAGSGGTFGWPDVGTAARELELAISRDDERAIRAAIAALKRTLRHAD